VRIISGTYRGKQFRPPHNSKARPTTDFAKEGLFNILLNHYELEDSDVLDLFAGTGSITLEFASREARSVIAVERDPTLARFIRDTCASMDMQQVQVIQGDVFRYLRHPPQPFDIVFADPPYDHPGLKEVPDLVLSSDLLLPGGRFILEHPGSISFAAMEGFERLRKYGSVHFSFFTAP
jgi:16S rRNA (guanine(966)-N(2))-methyltransferase RsmD